LSKRRNKQAQPGKSRRLRKEIQKLTPRSSWIKDQEDGRMLHDEKILAQHKLKVTRPSFQKGLDRLKGK